MMWGRWVAIAALNGLMAVALGAFAAHELKKHLDEARLAIFEVGVCYQMYHALALLGAAWAMSVAPSRIATGSAIFFLLGIVLFSGSLYALSFVRWKWLGPITPLGGACFLVAWALLAWAALRAPR